MRRAARAAGAALIGAILLRVVGADAATIEGTATRNGRPAAPAVVSLEGAGVTPPPSPPPRVVMDQKNLAFLPAVLPVVRGTVVEFTNSDDVSHNVFSPSAIARKFNLGTYGPGAARTVTLDEPGDVLVLCNIHMEMEAHILVLDTPFFASVAPDGTYRIPDVPAGTYTVRIWQRQWLTLPQKVDVPASGSVTLNLTAPQ